MKKYYYIAITTALALSLGSCSKDFLDEKPSQQLSPDQIKDAADKDPSLLEGNIAGVYSLMYKVGTGGTTSHDDFGQKGYDIYSDMIASDMVLGAEIYGWYRDVARYISTTDYTNTDAYKPWRYYYRIVLAANNTIETLGGADAVQEEVGNRYIMGQAKAMRGYAYFYLAQFYAKGYGTGSEKILPIYENSQQPNQPLSTSAEVYDFIIKDLEDAIVDLQGFNRASTAKDQINQYVAKGLLSYALAARGTAADLEQVVTLTDDIINNGGFSLTTVDELVARIDETTSELLNPQAGFNNVSTPSWMWGVDLTLASDMDLISWWGQVDLFTYSYAAVGDVKKIDIGLFDAIRSDDIRKNQFETNEKSNDYLAPINKFFDPARIKMGQRSVVTDYVYMRFEEMYLLNAEAKAKSGQDGPARARLKEMLAIRMDDVSYLDALSGTALLDEIYLQTRIELWGEGKSYLAMKRNKATITRGSNHLSNKGKSYAYDANELTFPIPEEEVLNNPVLYD